MRYAEFLKEGGTIGFIAPSFGCAIEPYKSGFINAQKTLKGMGYKLDLGPNAYEGSGIGISNTPEKCGEEVNTYFPKADNDVIISCGGGELMCTTLDYVDFELLKKSAPKWYMGYSDNTNLTLLLPTLCDTAAIYGPCAASFGMEPWHPAIQDAFDILTDKNLTLHNYDAWEMEDPPDETPLAPYNVSEPVELKLFPATEEKTIRFSGRMIGGCMDCLATLVGTRYDQIEAFADRYAEDGIIWFMESCDLNVFGIRRALWQMKSAGWFKHVKGFIIGRPFCYGQDLMGMDQYKAVTEILAEYSVPIILDADLGHKPPVMSFISGSVGEVELTRNDDKKESGCPSDWLLTIKQNLI